MRKREFLRELSRRLDGLTRNEINDIMEYYDELIEDTIERTGKPEEAVVFDLGPINEIAKRLNPSKFSKFEEPKAEKIVYDEFEEDYSDRNYKEDYRSDYTSNRTNESYQDNYDSKVNRAYEPKESKKIEHPHIFWTLVVILTFPAWGPILFAICAVIFAIGIVGVSLSFGGIVAVIAGLLSFSTSVGTGLVTLGVGILLIGLACIFVPLIIKLLTLIFKTIVNVIKALCGKVRSYSYEN